MKEMTLQKMPVKKIYTGLKADLNKAVDFNTIQNILFEAYGNYNSIFSYVEERPLLRITGLCVCPTSFRRLKFCIFLAPI